MKIILELTGLSRQLVGQKEVQWVVPEGTTYAQLVERLGQTYPELVGPLIDTDGKTFLSSNMFIINGDMALPAMVMGDAPWDGDRLTLVSVITGG